MVSLGQRLKSEREERFFTLEDIALATNIKMTYLEAIEHDDFDALPHNTFVKGYLRAYASFVGLDQEEVIKAYDYVSLLNRSDQDLVKDLLGTLSEPPPEKKTAPLVLAGSTVFLLAVAFMISFFNGQTLKPDTTDRRKISAVSPPVKKAPGKSPETVPTVVVPPKQVSLETPVKKPSFPAKKEMIQKITYFTAEITVKKIPIKKAIAKDAPKTKPIKIVNPKISLSEAPTYRESSWSSSTAKTIPAVSKEVKPKAALSKKRIIKKTALLPPEPIKKASGNGSGTISKPSLTVKAQKQLWLLVSVDRKGVEYVILRKGEAKSWRGKKRIVFSLGDPGAVEVAVNGQKLDGFKNKARKHRKYRISSKTSTVNFF